MREVWLDYLRVSACFLVMVVHATEPFYLGGDGALVLTATDAFWVSVFEGVARCCVPVFVLASSYLQFPLHYSTGEFFRRRAVRILPPMLFWTLVYAFVWGEPAANLKGLLLNFNYAAGHLWFVYMLCGLYLIMPLLSPWARQVGRRELSVYLGIWGITLCIPFVREAAGGIASLIQAADGLPAPALFPLWGEASWNPFGLFYYVSGFAGYLLAGLYIKKFVSCTRWTGILGWTMFLVGFLCIFSGFLGRIGASADGFPVAGPLEWAVAWETPLSFCGLPVALTAIGLTLAFRRSFSPAEARAAEHSGSCHDEQSISCSAEQGNSCHSVHSGSCLSEHSGSCHSELSKESGFYRMLIRPLSGAGYGMYLAHMLVLSLVSGWLRNVLGTGADVVAGLDGGMAADLGDSLVTGLDGGGVLGPVWTTPVVILATALCSFVVVGLAAVLLQRIPRVGKWIMG